MLIVKHTLVTEDIAEVSFCCDCYQCYGNCCIDGDAGAPLDKTEIKIIEKYAACIKPYMSAEGIEIIEKYGVYTHDPEGVTVTPLLQNKACAFVYFKGNIANCAIERAFIDKKIDFQKPISCHLYPIRITHYEDFDAVNYHKWNICKSALINGKEKKIPLYQFLKPPLIRKYGEEWYTELLLMVDYLTKKNKKLDGLSDSTSNTF